MKGIGIGLAICLCNTLMGIIRLNNYKHCTNCVTKGMSNINSGLRQMMLNKIFIIVTVLYTIVSFLLGWSILGPILAVVGLFIPNFFKGIQARDPDYIQNQRRFTRGGLRVAGKTTAYGAAAATAYFTGGNPTATKLGYKVGQVFGKGFDTAADNMTDVDIDYKAPDVSEVAKMVPGANQFVESPTTNTTKIVDTVEPTVAIEDKLNNHVHDPNDVPSDHSLRLEILKSYLTQVGFKQDDVNNASYEKCLSAVMNAGADGALHPYVRVLMDEGFDKETATLYIAQKRGVL